MRPSVRRKYRITLMVFGFLCICLLALDTEKAQVLAYMFGGLCIGMVAGDVCIDLPEPKPKFIPCHNVDTKSFVPGLGFYACHYQKGHKGPCALEPDHEGVDVWA